MPITTDQWRYAALARGEPKTRYTLMATEWLIDESIDVHFVVGQGDFPVWADTWFMVPEHLAKAYLAACATVAELERNIDAWAQKTGHRKHIHRE